MLKKFPKKLIGEILIEEGFLDPKSLEEALKIQKKEGGLIGEILIRRGWISEEELAIGLCKQLSLPFIRLANYDVNPHAVKLVPKEMAARYLFFPFELDQDTLSLAMADPVDLAAIEEVEKKVPLRVQVFLAPLSEIKQAIASYYKGYKESIPQGGGS